MFACSCGFSAVFAFSPRNIRGSASLSSQCPDEHTQNERGPSPLSPPLVVTTFSWRRSHRRRVPGQSRRRPSRGSERSSSRRTVRRRRSDRGAAPRHQHRDLCRRAKKRSGRPRRQNRGRRHRRWWRSHRSDRQRRLRLGRGGHGTKLERHRRRSSQLCSLIRHLDGGQEQRIDTEGCRTRAQRFGD